LPSELAQAHAVHRLDARLVGPHRGQRRAGADQVAGGDEQQVLVFLAPGASAPLSASMPPARMVSLLPVAAGV
jgi:hypothetical protein